MGATMGVTMGATDHREEARDSFAWHVLAVLMASVAFETVFLRHGLNLIDEGWPLYTAMRLHAGGQLYADTFFVFPPGHALVAWLAYALDPPGVVFSRALYSCFTVVLCIGIYVLGRRLMPPIFALVAALLLAVAAPSAHMQQLLFGYRYLVITVFALLAFARWLESRDGRWIFFAGALTGLALMFRLTPAFAVACAIGLGVIAAGRDWRTWVRAGSLYAAGLALVALPVIVYFLISVGPEKLWLEAVVRPVAMTDQQSLEMVKLRWHPVYATRKSISIWWVGIQFRAWALLYFGYAVALGVMWYRAVRERRDFAHPLLLAAVVWGGLFFVRSFGRSDAPHFFSAIPPVFLVLGHLASLGFGRLRAHWSKRARAALAVALVALWIFLGASDLAFQAGLSGDIPLEVLDGRIALGEGSSLLRLDDHISHIEQWTKPGDTILDLSASPLLFVLAGRFGPGYADLVMPGTFLSEEEERMFIARLEQNPPALVIFPGWLFDGQRERSVQMSSPLLTAWVTSRYERVGPMERFNLFLPRTRTATPSDAGG
jgi:hypothetical protein